jgi:uncharacterized protein with FMN-binding domain
MNSVKKYTQITIFLIFFASLIVIKDVLGHDDEGSVSVSEQNTQTPSPTISTTTSGGVFSNNSLYRDGTFTGSVEDAYYGNIQVQAVIQSGKIVDVIFLQYPNDNRTSIRINTQSNRYLKEEALIAQSANVNIVSGASDSSFAFRKSMQAALSLAHK